MRYLFETDLHAQLRTSAARFAETHIAPHADTWEEAGIFDPSLPRKLAEAHLLGLSYPESLGGEGGDLTHAMVASEALVLHGKSVGTVVGCGSHAIALPLLVSHGPRALHDSHVRPVLEGKAVCGLAVTEPGAGSDVANLSTRATRDGDAWLLDGTKTFITSGMRADWLLVAARTGGAGAGGLSLFVVDTATPGFSRTGPLKKMGWWASDTATLHFEACRIPAHHLIGEVGEGFALLAQNFVRERLLIASQCVAIGTLALEEALTWCRSREAFGRTLMGFQVTRHKLADMYTRLAAARALTGEVATRHLAGEDVLSLCAMAKNTATDCCSALVDDAVQLLGGQGYMRGCVVERLYRDARLYPIGGGTREVMAEIISKVQGF